MTTCPFKLQTSHKASSDLKCWCGCIIFLVCISVGVCSHACVRVFVHVLGRARVRAGARALSVCISSALFIPESPLQHVCLPVTNAELECRELEPV